MTILTGLLWLVGVYLAVGVLFVLVGLRLNGWPEDEHPCLTLLVCAVFWIPITWLVLAQTYCRKRDQERLAAHIAEKVRERMGDEKVAHLRGIVKDAFEKVGNNSESGPTGAEDAG